MLTETDPTRLLKDHGLSATAARLAVLAALMRHPHSDAQTLYTHARAISGALSQQAVYDNLRLFVEKGITRVIQPLGQPALYEPQKQDDHHHLICRACGRMEDVFTAPVSGLAPMQAHGFRVDETEIVFRGLCPACQAQNLSTSPQGEAA